VTRLAGTTVLITGGARGLGLRMARGALNRGAAGVVLWDMDADTLQESADSLRSSGYTVHTDVVDVTDNKVVQEAAEALPVDVDVVINNAGIVSGAFLTELTPEQIERTFGVNVLSLYWVTRAFLPGMVKRERGHVVTIASAAGLVGVAKQTDYSASKHAAVGFAESLRAELRASAPGVKTTLACPYYINTGMFDGVSTRVPWLLPILDEQDVANKILDSIERDRPLLAMPWAVRYLPSLRTVPMFVFDKLMDALGVNHTMDHFRGRTAVSPGGRTEHPVSADD
jgi:all-trans-retinol dehydrogenase (NAD+)